MEILLTFGVIVCTMLLVAILQDIAFTIIMGMIVVGIFVIPIHSRYDDAVRELYEHNITVKSESTRNDINELKLKHYKESLK